jgi:hypothetical protein
MVEGVNSCVIYLIHCNNLCKCHNVPLPSTTLKRKKRKAPSEKKSYISIRSNEKSEGKLRKNIPLTIASNRVDS